MIHRRSVIILGHRSSWIHPNAINNLCTRRARSQREAVPLASGARKDGLMTTPLSGCIWDHKDRHLFNLFTHFFQLYTFLLLAFKTETTAEQELEINACN